MRYLLFTLIFLGGCVTTQEFTSTQPEEKDLPLISEIKIIGFDRSTFDGDSGKAWHWKKPCEIIVTKPTHPEDSRAFCTIGHELWHCLTGSFHHDFEVKCGN